jgi:hypothetical protein
MALTDDWARIMEKLVEVAKTLCTNCKMHSTTTFRAACRASLERLYCPTVAALRRNVDPDSPDPKVSKALDLWEEFADTLEVTQAGLREKWKAEMQCCNPSCPKRRKRTPMTGGVLKCGKCRLMFYCGRECQRAYVASS